MNLFFIAVGILLFFGLCISAPLVAMAEMHEITSIPKVRCGPKCVIESFVFDTEEEAEAFAAKRDTRTYQLTSNPGKWFVDVMMTEQEAGLI